VDFFVSIWYRLITEVVKMKDVEFISDLSKKELEKFKEDLKRIVVEANSRLYLSGEEPIFHD
ncbi:MAG: hypothetical protein Athens101428_624, partial [Candidatus Berkelbacteria bacterium Athens1014_28]